MGQSSWSGPIRSARVKVDDQFHFGHATLAQSVEVSADSADTFTGSIYVPNNVQILDLYFDVTTAFDSATSATADVGTSSGDSTYASGVDLTTAGRISAGFSAAELSAIQDTGTENEVVVTVTTTGATTTGTVFVTVLYVQ